MIVVDPDFVNADGAAASEWFNKKKKTKLFADNSTSQSLVGSTAFPHILSAENFLLSTFPKRRPEPLMFNARIK